MYLCENCNDNFVVYTITQKEQIIKFQVCTDTIAQITNEVSKCNV